MTSKAATFPTFYIDDSECLIAGKRHTILAAIAFPDEHKIIAQWLEQKRVVGLKPYEEVKWGSKALSFEQRREFVPLLNGATGIVIIDETGKQKAAIEMCTQVWRYCEEEGLDGFRLRFDKDILVDRKEFAAHASSLFPPCAGWSEHDSANEQLIQCADFLAGAVKLKVDFGVGARDPKLIVASGDEVSGDCSLGFFFFAALRYCLWGKVRDVSSSESIDPRKFALGRGLVVHSSLSQEIIDDAVAHLDGDYMGCIH